ncbi:Nn.00g111940.m01.CDS01 [Neocucurbitaria sp. VM-36]
MSDSQPQQAGGGGGGGQRPQQPLRADDILKLQSLPDDEKQKYRLIMQNFWNMIQQHPQGSPEHTTARQKLSEWSQKFIARERTHRGKMKAQQQQQQQQQQQANQGQSSQGNQAGQQNPVKQEAAQAPNRGAEGVAAPTSQGQQPANPGQARPQNQVDPAILKHVHEFPIQLPPNAPPPGTPEYDVKLKEYRNGYLNMLAKQASYAESRRKITNQIQERQNAGQEVPQEFLTMKARVEKEHAQMKDQLDKFRRLQKQWKDEREQKQAQQQPQGQSQVQQPSAASPQQQQQQQQQPQRQPSQPNMPTQPQIKEEPQIKVEGGQVPQPQPAAQFNMQGNQQQVPPQQQNPQIPPSLPQQQQQQQQQQVRPPPAPHSQSMPLNQGQQFVQPGQQQQNFQQQQQRPQINPMQANAMQHQQSNSPHPQSAASNAPAGPPVPLSHQAAVSAANRSYTDPQRTNTPMQQGGQGNFGSREREQLNNPKMPIPRHLNVTSPSAVHMGQARPTMQGPTNGAPGPMGQPVIPRPPPFQLEGEGDRVLSKRKLDELVRQVTGGSEEALTPEVEEAVLQLADDFVDNVISSACKLSKLRESPQLDIRDIQVILERNYNIRIPGYASDEVRTVRKIVPAPGWAAKMNAVSAAKVMGGKTDF